MSKIYESPDGGNTIYSREHGELARTLVSNVTHNGNSYLDGINELQLWNKIRQAAKTDAALQSALERVKIMYYLSMENGNNS